MTILALAFSPNGQLYESQLCKPKGKTIVQHIIAPIDVNCILVRWIRPLSRPIEIDCRLVLDSFDCNSSPIIELWPHVIFIDGYFRIHSNVCATNPFGERWKCCQEKQECQKARGEWCVVGEIYYPPLLQLVLLVNEMREIGAAKLVSTATHYYSHYIREAVKERLLESSFEQESLKVLFWV